ncbi:zinc finger protein-like [Tropilaelaps mercedesae]|uniref:Zinc finger protein-like n=1 Tax=Tropilaelaps mercedesae TaxID=418985 RepID=A0A1V9X894_9ACAR|nr:zinc finger protein-like [Tropilaelaps mercedesae]
MCGWCSGSIEQHNNNDNNNHSGKANKNAARVNGNASDGSPLARPHQCPLCYKNFTRSNHLADHVRRHTGERPYLCSFCSKRFATKSHLREHERTHVGGKLECHLCPSSFTRRRQALQHLRGHGIDTALLENNINIWPVPANRPETPALFDRRSPPAQAHEPPSTTTSC